MILIYPVSAQYFNMVIHNFIFIQVEGILGNDKVRGVNLGGWLVIEGWIKPSLFEGIPNGDMLVSFIFFLVMFCSVSSLDAIQVFKIALLICLWYYTGWSCGSIEVSNIAEVC